MGVCVSTARVRRQPLLPTHPRTRASVGREKTGGGSVLEGSLMSTFWSLSLRDKEESM